MSTVLRKAIKQTTFHILTNLCLFSFFLPTLHADFHSAERCTSIRHDEGDGSLAGMPVLDQGMYINENPEGSGDSEEGDRSRTSLGLCYAITASQFLDAYLNRTGQRPPGGSRASVLGVAQSYIDLENVEDSLEGGRVTRAIEAVSAGNSLCTVDSATGRESNELAEALALNHRLERFHESMSSWRDESFWLRFNLRGPIVDLARSHHGLVCRVNNFYQDHSLVLPNDVFQALETENDISPVLSPMIRNYCAQPGNQHRVQRWPEVFNPPLRKKNREDLLHRYLEDPAGLPIPIDYCSRILRPDRGLELPTWDKEENKWQIHRENCGKHASLIVGRRFNRLTHRCEFLVRNSWGSRCPESYVTREEGGYITRCEENGQLWINSEDLASAMYRMTAWEPLTEN
jgi:hypothetical protein